MAKSRTSLRSGLETADLPRPPKSLGGLSREALLDFLKEMLLSRRFEEAAEEAYAIGKIGGFCHLYIGQEAVGVGAIRAIRPDDYVITAYREHAQAINKGISPRAVMAELFGRSTGCSGGKGGSMHLFDASVNFMGGYAIVGGHVPLAAGFGWAIKYRGEDRVCLCFLGDAAVNQGSFHETLNMAAVWKLPVVYVVENNEYGMGTAYARVSTLPIFERACSYDIPSTAVDGQDVVAVHTAVREYAERARRGEGPSLIEARTYRYKGHSMSDPVHGVYRSKEEVEDRMSHADPIVLLRSRMEAVGLIDQATMDALDNEVRAVVADAVKFADASPVADPSQLYTHVYHSLDVHGRLFLDRMNRSAAKVSEGVGRGVGGGEARGGVGANRKDS
ncbi:MAG: pyruvate dehydrogenase (acetyl-transferring) E1 component subunit alpha [Gemmatimonadetes bacterium]|nr:pyruvate dehydrogenase (acetyl-transferring) E1 component subunit alpha [Gemmatimonadota bacterium]